MALALLLIIFKGSSEGQKGLFGNALSHYIEETATSVVVSSSANELADINSVFAYTGNSGIQKSLALNTIQDNSLQANNPTSADYLDYFRPEQVIEYTVQSGDTISSIAEDFGVSTNTVIWANNIRNPDSLSLGQILKIPPVTGIIYTVKSGDTISAIAKKYQSDPDKIMSFNKIQNDKDLEVGNELMLPDGVLPGPQPSLRAVARSSGSGIYIPVGDGQCVAFVQAHGFSKYRGNAYQWAKYINTPTPMVGDAVVFKQGKYGHVALITAVKSSSIQIVEQNYYGLYIIDHREISLSDRSIVGFVL